MDDTTQFDKSDKTWQIITPLQWEQATASHDNTCQSKGILTLGDGEQGRWTSQWHSMRQPVSSFQVNVEARIDLFTHKTIETIVKGSQRPFADSDGLKHTWYGRCMIAIVDSSRWIMALRSGIGHVNWGMRDAIHLITSNNEGRSWSPLNRWFDGSVIDGTPYEDGCTHSEPGLYRMPNGDLILQFWRTSFETGTKQLRSRDNGKTWLADHDRIRIVGVPGAADDRALGCQDYFIDPDNSSHVYMAFEYFHYNGRAGCVLARSVDNCRSYQFVSWLGPLADEGPGPHNKATFEPAIEYVGNRSIIAILRDATANRFTWQTVSMDMGLTFGQLKDISSQVDGGVTNGLWQRARLFKESNPCFQRNNCLDYSKGEGRLWGFGIHSNGGGYTRKPVVYWSDDNGRLWQGPQLLHGTMQPGTDTGYGDLKCRADHTFVGATYYVNPDHVKRGNRQIQRSIQAAAVDPTQMGITTKDSDVEQYTFGGQRASIKIEFDRGNTPSTESKVYEIHDGSNTFSVSAMSGNRWRFIIQLEATSSASSPGIAGIHVEQ